MTNFKKGDIVATLGGNWIMILDEDKDSPTKV